MNASIYRITLDLQEAHSDVLLNVNRGDTNRILYISLTDGGHPYQISKDCCAVFTAVKPDGKKVFNDCEISGNEIVYTLTPQTVVAEGVCQCEIKLYGSNDHLLTSSRFDLVINETVFDEAGIESSDETDALTRRVNEAVDAYLDEHLEEAVNRLADEAAAIEDLTEAGFVDPVGDGSNGVFVDENDCVYTF